MSLKFWLGASNSDKSRQLYKYILEEADRYPGRQYLVVVPEQFGLATQQELVALSKNHGILNIDVLSFTRLAHRIIDEVGAFLPDTIMINETGKSLVIGMLAEKHKEELSVFSEDTDKPGYTDRFKSIISEFMQYGISPEKVGEMSAAASAAGHGLLSEKLHDIAIIYSAFKDHIRDRYTTVEETLDTLGSLIPRSDTIKNGVVVFDGFTGFTPVQNKLIGVLLEYALQLHVSLVYEDCIQDNNDKTRISEHELFNLSKRTIDQLGRMADERRVPIEDPYKADRSAFSNARYFNSAFAYNTKDNADKLNNTSVQIFAAANPDDEIRQAASKIAELVRNGYRYKDIAILTGDIDVYRHPAERVFSRYGIPHYIDRTDPILLNPFIEYIRAFLGIIADNYSITSVFRFLKTYLTDLSEDEINMLENYCIAANIKGYRAWHERFDAGTMSAGADELLELNALREKVISRTDMFTQSLSEDSDINAGSCFTVRQFCTALYSVIVSDGIEDKLRASSETFLQNADRRLAAEYEQVYVRIMDILDQLCELIPEEKLDIRAFLALVNAGLDSVRIGTIPDGLDYVLVGDLTRSRVGDVKALFIVGANDGIIPKAGGGAGLINDNDREFLLGTDDKLILAPTAREDLYTQQLYVYMALSAPSDRLFISYSCVSTDGKSLIPSYIVKKILAADPGIRIERNTDRDAQFETLRSYSCEQEAFDDLVSGLYPAISGKLSPKKMIDIRRLIRHFLSNEKYREHLLDIIRTQLTGRRSTEGDSIGSALAHALYGSKITQNITKLESYANCAYRYFLEYGLSLRDREVFSFEARDVGNIFHDSMKQYSQLVVGSGINWADTDEKTRHKLMDEAVDKALEQYRDRKLSSSARYAYMEHRIRRIMRTSADVIAHQIRKGNFEPKYFEVDFDSMKGSNISIRLSDEDMLRLRGRIDRIDTCETDEGIYIRVIDYKSSHHRMDLAAVYEGRQLQLLVYLSAATALEEGSVPVIPAGVLYYNIDDPVITSNGTESDDEIRKKISKSLCLSGLVNSDPQVLSLMDNDIATDPTVLSVTLTSKGEARKSKQTVTAADLDVLAEFVTKKIKAMGCELMSGNIAIPVPDKSERYTEPDCRYCPYTGICINRGRSENITDDDEETDETEKPRSEMSNEDWIGKMRIYGTDN